MEIVLHAGVHFTDEERLIKCIQRNEGDFATKGIAVPKPFTYRRLLRDILIAMDKAPASADARDLILDAMLEGNHPERVILSNSNFFSAPNLAIKLEKFYPWAGERVAHMQTLFAGDQIELCLAISNPATFVPALHRTAGDGDFAKHFGMTDPHGLRWSELIGRIRKQAPEVAIKVWCNEDTPLIWAQLVREIAGLEHNEKIKGGFDLLTEIMSAEGMKRFRAYLKEHPNMNEMQKRRVIVAFLDKFALDDELEEEIDLPGWSETLIDELTDLYDEDVYEISRMTGVEMIAP